MFGEAIESTVRAGDLVLDIGTGAGLTAMIAARAGARVITCEANPIVADLARRIVAHNGLHDRITVIAKPSHDLEIGKDLPWPADVLIAEVFDCGLVGESALPTFTHAVRELVCPNARLIPGRGRLYCQVIESEQLWQLNHVNSAMGFDLGLFNEVSTDGYFPVRLELHPYRALSSPTILADIDFSSPASPIGSRRVLTITDTGMVHAVVLWFELELSSGHRVTNAPGVLRHWHQALHTTTPQPARAGEPITITLGGSDDNLKLDISVGAVTATPATSDRTLILT